MRARDVVRKARTKSIDVLAGSDTLMPWTVPGDALLREIDELAEAFGENDAALTSATAVNGAHFDRTNIGKIAPGMRADLLVLRPGGKPRGAKTVAPRHRERPALRPRDDRLVDRTISRPLPRPRLHLDL